MSRTVALPSDETFNKALSRSKLCQPISKLFPSGDQSAPNNPFHPFTKTSRIFPVDVERKWILPSFAPKTTIARSEPSGDKLQLQLGSIWGFCTLAAPHIEPVCFRSIPICCSFFNA